MENSAIHVASAWKTLLIEDETAAMTKLREVVSEAGGQTITTPTSSAAAVAASAPAKQSLAIGGETTPYLALQQFMFGQDPMLLSRLLLSTPRTTAVEEQIQREEYNPHAFAADAAPRTPTASELSRYTEGKWMACITEVLQKYYKQLDEPSHVLCGPRQVTIDHVFAWWHRWRMEDECVYGPSATIPDDEVIAANVAVDELFTSEKQVAESSFALLVKLDQSNLYDEDLLMIRVYFNKGRTFSIVRLPIRWISSGMAKDRFLFMPEESPSYHALLMERAYQKTNLPSLANQFLFATQIAHLPTLAIETFMRNWDATHTPFFFKASPK